MTFDQKSRYRACSDIIERISSEGNILDVGSGPECMLGQFLPERLITYVDPLLKIIEGDSTYQIPGNVFDHRLDNKNYDYVSCIDTLEHIPMAERCDFIKRISSLAERGIVLGFPCSDDDVAFRSDKTISSAFRKIYGKEYQWLDEHFSYGLPKKEDVVKQLNSLGWSVSTVGHGHAPWISLLLSVVVSGWSLSETHSHILRVSKRFMDGLYQYDFNPPFYRWFVVALKNAPSSLSLKFGAPIDALAINCFNDILTDAFSSILSLVLNSGDSFCLKYIEDNAKMLDMANWGKDLQIRLEQADKRILESNAEFIQLNNVAQDLKSRLEDADRRIQIII
jgi:hypothetical protein